MSLPQTEFYDNGQRVPAADPVCEQAIPRDDLAAIRQQDLLRTLQWLTSGRVGALAIGRRVLLMSYALRPEGTQEKLAKRLGVSPGRVSRALQGINLLMRYLDDPACPAESEPQWPETK